MRVELTMLFVFSDGRESFVVTKVFDVEQIGSTEPRRDTDGLEFINDIPASDVLFITFVKFLLILVIMKQQTTF